MAFFRPSSPLVQRWLVWMDGHCALKGHPPHLRYQCRESRKVACRGVALLEDPEGVPTKDQPPHAAAEWLEWMERACTVTGHGLHFRHQCRESREQALRGCVIEGFPND